MQKNIPYIIAGPTASGKTDIALALARLSGRGVISADSRQVYKGLNIGTAAPQGAWQGSVFMAEGAPYHLVDFLDINDSFNVSSFCARARPIEEAAQGRVIFAGGTGMYLQGYFSGLDALPQADSALRAELAAFTAKHGKAALHSRLAGLDAQSAAQIPPGNIQRVMRALEICLLSGSPASTLRTGKFKAHIPHSRAKFIYINWDKDLLNKRIERRTQIIFEPMLKEAQTALNAGYKEDAPGLRSLGYREAIAFLKGAMPKEEALNRITILTRQYAKRQRTWFARYDNMLKIDLTQEAAFDPQKTAQRILEWKALP